MHLKFRARESAVDSFYIVMRGSKIGVLINEWNIENVQPIYREPIGARHAIFI